MRADFSLGDWVIRPGRGCIERSGEVVHIHPKPMLVLECLADAEGEVVTRDGLHQAVWPGVIVTDDALTQCIAELRKAFGDSAKDPQVIKTVPKVGFRLLLPAKDLVDNESARASRAREWLLGFSAVIVLLLVVVAWRVIGTGQVKPHAMQPQQPSVAVLPFANRSAREEDAFFVDGIHDELLTHISKIGAIKTISRTSVMRYADTNKSIPEIARELGVSTVLEGSVQRAGTQVRINVQLIDAQKDDHLWSDTYDRQLTTESIFAIQSEIARAIAKNLKANLSPKQKQRMSLVPTENLEAYEAYLRGNEYFNRGLGDPSVVRAAEMYEDAVGLDPAFVLGHVGLAKAHSRIIFQNIDRSQNRQRLARQSIEKAIQLDPELPDVLAAKGWYYYWALNDYETALTWFKPAFEKLPNDSELLLGMGLAERRLGLWDEALTHLSLSFDLDPLSNEKAIEVGISYAFAHDYAEAVAYFEAATALAPNQFRSYAHLADALIADDGSLDSALKALQKGGGIIGREEFIRRMLSPQPSWTSQMLLLSAFPEEFENLGLESLSGLQAIYYLALSAEQFRRNGRQDFQHEAANALLGLIGDQADLHHQWAGLAYAHLGHKEEAELLLATVPEKINSDARDYQRDIMIEAYGQLLLGDQDSVIERLDHALSVPGPNSINTILVAPVWRDLRQHGGIHALQNKYGHFASTQ